MQMLVRTFGRVLWIGGLGAVMLSPLGAGSGSALAQAQETDAAGEKADEHPDADAAAHARQDRAAKLDQARQDLDRATRSYDETSLRELSDRLEKLGGDGTDRTATVLRLRSMFSEASILRYRRKVQEHPGSSAFKERQVEQAEAGEALAVKLCESAPDDADVLILEGELIALQITGPNGALVGPRAAMAIERALELEPENALAHLAAGRRYLYTPGAFGGSLEAALEHLEKAERILNTRERELLTRRRDEELAGVKDPDERKARLRELVTRTRREVWYMHEEILVQLGVAYERQGRAARAKVSLRRALASNSDDEQAKLLLERLEKAEEE